MFVSAWLIAWSGASAHPVRMHAKHTLTLATLSNRFKLVTDLAFITFHSHGERRVIERCFLCQSPLHVHVSL
jgi:hypothetical protein